MVNLTFPDGSKKEFESGISIEQIAGSISSGLKKAAVAGEVNGHLYDLNRPITEDATIKIITKKDKEAFSVLNHSTAHLMAQAVKNLWPKATFGVGPDIEEGFYYDINTNDEPISVEDLPKIEKEMKRITGAALEMTRNTLPREEALAFFKGDKYKTEIISALPEGEIISTYTQGDFTDLCRGGHVGNTKNIKHFKLLSIAGAYWRGKSDNEMLQRIYGTSWFTKEDLDDHLRVLEDRKKFDHRKIGKELRLFEIIPEAGQGLAILLPKGYAIRKQLEDYVYELERKNGYLHVNTPVLGTKWLYETSGHWANYRENMFPVMERDGEEFVLRPMSCPHHMLIYRTELRSYRDLPIKYAENVIMHRYEASGSLTGLERVRAMTLTDSHMFVRPDQIKQEVQAAYDLIIQSINDLGLDIHSVELSLRNDEKSKFHDNDELWNMAEDMMRDIVNEMGIEYTEMPGEAAFYGPKIDIQVKTMLGHIITLSTIQLDFLLPDRFDLTYVAEGGAKERPVVIHRGLVSTWERLISVLIEQYKGAFPLWLAPIQVEIIPVNLDLHMDYAEQLKKDLIEIGMRVEIDKREESMGKKIRDAQTQKINYQLVLGDTEQADGKVTYRKYGSTEQVTVSYEEFKQMALQEIKDKTK